MGRDWTKDEDDFLKANYGKLSAAQCAAELNTGRSRGMVIGRASRLNLSSSIIGGGWAKGSLRQRGDPSTKVRKPHVSNGRPTIKPTLADRIERKQNEPYKEPEMPVLTGDQKLHSRQYSDLEDNMCQWPVYVEQGVQMYCAAKTARLPGRWATYCDCHTDESTRRDIKRAPQVYKPGRLTR